MVSLFRKVIPKQVRISIFIIVIATFVTTVDYMLKAFAFYPHKKLGAFIALIVVNCLILGRQEAFASKRPFFLAVPDAIGMSAGFTLAMVMIGAVREMLGYGTLMKDTAYEFSVFGPNFEPWAVMILSPGGFFTLGALLMVFGWVRNILDRRKEREAELVERSVA